MELNAFVNLIAEQYDNTPASEFKPETSFRELAEWDSLIALSVISVIDEEFEAQITGADLRGVTTIEELFKLVLSKL